MSKRCWFPNLLTTANLFCGFLAITFVVHAMEPGAESLAWFRWAGFTICLAALCDALDGRLARKLRVSSPFGKELDSLADVVSFGVAPALLVYEGFFRDSSLPGYSYSLLWMIICGLFCCCGAARLARYNVTGSSGRFFTGMPIPAAGLTITGLALFPSQINQVLMAAIVLLAAFLMISTLRFPNFERLIFDAPLPIRMLFLSLFAVALVDLANWFFLLPLSYMAYGIMDNVITAIKPEEITDDGQ
jgi:CDP-diacylglycerol---serine O-phosphatidyltransferase